MTNIITKAARFALVVVASLALGGCGLICTNLSKDMASLPDAYDVIEEQPLHVREAFEAAWYALNGEPMPNRQEAIRRIEDQKSMFCHAG